MTVVYVPHSLDSGTTNTREKEFCIDNLLVRINFIIEMIWGTSLAPWKFEFPFPGSLIPTFLGRGETCCHTLGSEKER